VVTTDSFVKGENVSYLIDYEVNSSTGQGFKTKGSVYIRGSKGENGFDSYKFVLEKGVDFNDLDSDILLEAIEATFKMFPPPPKETEPPRFNARNTNKFNRAN